MSAFEIVKKFPELDASDEAVEAVQEYLLAVQKHPKFCDGFTNVKIDCAVELEKLSKSINEHDPVYADEILIEEVNEARTAWLQGDKKHCRQELAQCAAVIFRMMKMCN